MSNLQGSTTTTKTFHFVDSTHNGEAQNAGDRIAQKRSVRAQAARASANTRLETIRRRAIRISQKPGQNMFPACSSIEPPEGKESPPRPAAGQHQKIIGRYRDREASVTLHSHVILGGAIPMAQAEIAILAQFLNRFETSAPAERPWTSLVLGEASTSPTTPLVASALQANASALCANDLQRPEITRHATKLYLSTITRLRTLLKSPKWRDSTVLYTCMVLTLYECIQTGDTSACHAHVRGVIHLIQQKGPQDFIGGLEHRTFRYYRINIFLMSLHDRQPCFLAEEEWKTIPFSGDCPPKTVLDLLTDILVEIPGILAAIEVLITGRLGRYALLQKAFELVYWTRCLIGSLERWKEQHIWTYPTICNTPYLKNLDLIALCELETGLIPYDAKLGEAINCYLAAHLILARIAQRLGEKSFVIRTALRPPHSIRDLVAAIALVSEKHISANTSGMINLMVTTFPLKVAESTTEVDDPALIKIITELLGHLSDQFSRRYNINYSVPNETRPYEV